MDQSITLKQLRCLLAVSETLHFRRGAERLGITQPALTAQIQNLEHVLDVRLLERGRSGVHPTPIGREIIQRARRVIEESDALTDFAVTSRRGLVGTLRLGATPTVGPYLLPEVVSKLHREHTELRLYIREGPPQDLDTDLGEGRHDVLLTQLPSASEEYVDIPLFTEPLYLAMAEDHPLATRKVIAPADLDGQSVLSLSPRYRLSEQIARFSEQHGARVLTDYEGTSLDAIRQMVAMDMGVAFLPALYVRTEIRDDDGVTIRPLKGRVLTRAMGLVHRRRAGRSPAIDTLAEVVAEAAKQRLKGAAAV
ncbi:MAG: hydrogen peroxide-inducible genes activator [Pseudomonadota bacterium]